jgi:ABC-2 type transport system ATP-binding protein
MTYDTPAPARPSARTSTGAIEAAPSESNAVLAVDAHGLVKTFGTNRAVDGIDLSVREGEILGVLGPNGAGKTTMLQMLATLLPIDAGSARIFGYDVGRQPHQVRQLIGVTGQYASVDELLTGRENLWLFGRLQGLSSKQAHRAADDLLAKFDLTEAGDRGLAQFSGGMRRRLDLAASLITKPALIFLDEPTTGLDPRTRGQMWETIRGLVADGCTILLTTQYLDEADELADRIAVIDRGRKVAEGTPEELKAQVGGSSIRVQLAEGVDAAAAAALAEAVAGHRPIFTPTGTGFSVSLANANQAADILIALRNHNVAIANAAIEQPSLDEVFMALTGHPGVTPALEPEMSEA